ncbi:class I adenylate-forming enzyme family protein [Sciscionella marina]|uniref:class I adenylate-forming enzyme family protein n=1 Tax=Sciscionella marina TaxID=508770 RepID=UPI00036A2C65|nr:AMP-binding protein [Sciscionella marina]
MRHAEAGAQDVSTDKRPWLKLYDHPEHAEVDVEEATVYAVIMDALARYPDYPCLHHPGGSLTKGEVSSLVCAFAFALRHRGVSPGERVALYLQNVPEFVIALLGIWRAGAIAVLVNPMNKQRELDLILRDSGAAAVVCQSSLAPMVAVVRRSLPLRLVVVVNDVDADHPDDACDFWDEVRSAPDGGGEAHALAPGDPACLTYTSGTTGPPKGAINTHGKILFSSRTFQRWMPLTRQDTVLGIAPLFHITGLVGHVTASLVSGAPLIVLGRFTPEAAVDATARYKATFAVGAITAFQAILNLPGVEAKDLASLKKIYSGGGPVAPALTAAFEQKFGTSIHTIYGLTESTSPAIITPSRLRAPVDSTTGALSIGVPVYNTMVRVVDEKGREVAPDESGELVIRGPQVVDGYWRMPEESAHAVRNGWLYTGDVGYRDTAGWFYLIDRKKDQINASGYKIWPREVEDVLYEHPGVREAAVVGVPDAYRGETVRAYISVRDGHDAPTPDKLVEFCKERMAAYKYPRQVVILPELPKTASGKILRRSLRDQARQSETGGEDGC